MSIDWKQIGIKELAALISEKLREKGIDAILVGGACVSIYTKNRYMSFDLDFVTYETMKKVASVMEEVGFRRESSRHFVRGDCPFFIEFVSPPAAVGSEPLKGEEKLKTRLGTVVLLTPTNCVKDRLAAYYHWNDPQALKQALMVAKVQKVSLSEVKRWSEKEGHAEKYREFLKRMKKKN
ncbi:MAG TPA: nucleotidyltransferase [Thermodesulfovibrionales bacterium]|nr:nucleotidyltransferase [Thermodesulfovibrionales bacterium]